jgi:DNA helicase-4
MRVKPSFWAPLLGISGAWIVELADYSLVVKRIGKEVTFLLDEETAVSVDYQGRWAALVIRKAEIDWRLGGLCKLRARKFEVALADARRRIEEQRRTLQKQLEDLACDLPVIVDWVKSFTDEIVEADRRRLWVTQEQVHAWVEAKPVITSESALRDPEHREFLDGFSTDSARALLWWNADLPDQVRGRNQRFLSQEKLDEADFFNSIESQPLTEEQIEAVVCFDNRVQVIASAGSGKTSTMIAKAGYALHRGLVTSSGILMLAFNSKASVELGARVVDRLGSPAQNIAASTFHAFGMKVIGQATGRKPSLAPWLENGKDIERIANIAAGLREGSATFRVRWNLFRLVFNQQLKQFGVEEETPDYDSATRKSGYRTMQGEIVKSQEELLIANWLHFNGVAYVYEREYEIDTRTSDYRQYVPDFYFPDIDCYLEHFALDENGNPPAEWATYLDGVRWKRQLHRDRGTDLIETTSHTVRNGTAFTHLERELTGRGIHLNPDTDRPEVARDVLTQADMASLIRTFLTHVKNNQLTPEELVGRSGQLSGHPRFRAGVFLQIFEPIRAAWDSELRQNDLVDFEDMLNVAADLIEAGRWESPYALVMVDEMQDANEARARLIRALTAKRGRHLFAVGDDWQSINRFAGADLSIMTGFEKWFGPTETLRLEQTFRSAQRITDISSDFIRKNPAQLTKTVRSVVEGGDVVGIAVTDERKTSGAIRDLLDVYEELAVIDSSRRTVFVLGRYRRNEEYVPGDLHRWSHLEVGFHTVHGAKGLEADYVIITGLVERAFPSAKEDDPILQLAMPDGDTFEDAEERRLFYVAMTRAKLRVDLITVAHKESRFVLELINDGHLTLRNLEGKAISPIPCAQCGQGQMVPRSGIYGSFLGCSRYPNCRATLRTDRTRSANL